VDRPYERVRDEYRVRFQVAFPVRDAKPSGGLEDVMTGKPTSVYHRAPLARCLVHRSHAVIRPLPPQGPGFRVNDVKAWLRSRKEVGET
jgi:hypothetical protein